MTTDLDALIAEARGRAGQDMGLSDQLLRGLSDALESTLAELRQERERADGAERALLAVDDYRIADWQKLELERDEAEAALSRAEETIAAIRVARANHPECDKVPDGISCGWKRAVQDIDATLTEYEGQP